MTKNKLASVSRMIEATGKQYFNEDGGKKIGEDYAVVEDTWGDKGNNHKIGKITRWKNGYLHSIRGEPAVEYNDTHLEYWYKGKLQCFANKNVIQAAVISNYWQIEEYWINGKRINNPNTNPFVRAVLLFWLRFTGKVIK